MSIENVHSDLNKATKHLEIAVETSTAIEDSAHTIWEIMGALITKPSSLYIFHSLSSRADRMVVPKDITTMVDTAASGYTEALEELSEIQNESSSSGNNHVNNALTHLNNAVELLREGNMDATTQAKIVESNIEKLGEGVATIFQLFYDMNDAARRLEHSAGEAVPFGQRSMRYIEELRKIL